MEVWVENSLAPTKETTEILALQAKVLRLKALVEQKSDVIARSLVLFPGQERAKSSVLSDVIKASQDFVLAKN